VTDAGGDVANATVKVFLANDADADPVTAIPLAETQTFIDGTYRINGIDAGDYDVYVTEGARSARVDNQSVVAGSITDVNVVLP
jgi:hypothetical protein